MASEDISAELVTYSAFRPLQLLARHRVPWLTANTLIALLFAALFGLAAWLDDTFVLDGSYVGLLEHPAIYAFLVLHIVVPPMVTRSLRAYESLSVTRPTLFSPELISALKAELATLRRSLKRGTNLGRVFHSALIAVGLTLFIWNSYQNQRPFELVGVDFWDSRYHPYGYWLTRVYKCYFWLFFMPAVAHAQCLLVVSLRRFLTHGTTNELLRVEPFHPDGCGGMRLFVDPVVSPMIPVVLVATCLALGAVLVHERYDITTIGGLVLACSVFFTLYFVPGAALRGAIARDKERQLADLSEIRMRLLRHVTAPDTTHAGIQEATSAMEAVSVIAMSIHSLPNWPQLLSITRGIGLALASPVVAWMVQEGRPYALATLEHWLK